LQFSANIFERKGMLPYIDKLKTNKLYERNRPRLGKLWLING